VRAVHNFHDLAVDVARQHAGLFPFLVQRRRRALQIEQLAFGLAPFVQRLFGHFQGDLVDVAVHFLAVHLHGGGNTEMRRDIKQFNGIFDLVVLGLFACHREKHLGHRPAMVGMGGGAGGDHSDEIARADGIGGGAAESLTGILTVNPALGQGQTARPHGTVFTTNTLQSDSARLHGHGAVKHSVDFQFLRPQQHFLGCRINGCLTCVRQLGILCYGFFFHICHLCTSQLK
jgi:hypothetical protein